MAGQRVGIIFGAPGGIGTGVCQSLVAEGWRVVALGRSEDKLQALSADLGPNCEYRIADAYDAAAIDAAINDVATKHGRIDGLVNGVADTRRAALDGLLLDTSVEAWDQSFQSSIRAYFVACRAAVPVMLAGGGGAIVNISSIGGIRGEQWLTAYAAAKAGIIQLSRNIAAQYGRQGIRCNTIIPGLIVHDRTREVLEQSFFDRAFERMSSTRLGEPEDIGALTAFLLGDKAGFINGEAIVADGGQTSRGADWLGQS